MPELPDFHGDLGGSVEHILNTSEDTPEDLREQLRFAQVALKEETSHLIDELKKNLQLENEKEITIRHSQDARLALAHEVALAMEEDQNLDAKELVTALTNVLQEELVESVIKVEDLDTLPVDELREMEKMQPGTLLFAFTTWGDRHKHLDVTQLGNDYLPKDGDSFTIDFRGNEEAYWNIGAADLMPPEVRGIKVLMGSGQEKVSERRIGLKGELNGGFYDAQGEYIPVFTGDKVTINNADPKIREEYYDAETKTWNYEAYEAKHGEEEAAYAIVPTSVEGGQSGRVSYEKGNAQYLRSFESLREERVEWVDTAEAASETFKRKLGVDVPVSTIFGVIAKESCFDPNAVSSSGCTGLGQFGKDAWTDFIKYNREIARTVLGNQGLDLPGNKAKILALRTNPILNIYATTWYLGKLAKDMGYVRVDSHNIKDVYLNYHEGAGGRRTLEKYVTKGKGRLEPWQKKDPYGYWKSINHYADTVASQTAHYESQSS